MRRARNPSRRVLILGDINLDVIGQVQTWPEPGGECLCPRLELHCGGVGANIALALRPWGIHPLLIGCVGRDPFGDFLLRALKRASLDTRYIQRKRRALTGMLYINVTPDGQRTFFGSRGANQFTEPSCFSSSFSKNCAAAQLFGYNFLNPGPEKLARQILRAFHAVGKPVFLDVGMEPAVKIPQKILRLLPEIDLLFVSSEEAAALTGRANPRKSFLQLLRAGAREIVMKLGKRGCLIMVGAALGAVPAFAVRTVDSTGAGDAFTAAFLQARLRGWPAPQAALLANAAGAAAASEVGAGLTLYNVARSLRLLRREHLPQHWADLRLKILSRISTYTSSPAQ